MNDEDLEEYLQVEDATDLMSSSDATKKKKCKKSANHEH